MISVLQQSGSSGEESGSICTEGAEWETRADGMRIGMNPLSHSTENTARKAPK